MFSETSVYNPVEPGYTPPVVPPTFNSLLAADNPPQSGPLPSSSTPSEKRQNHTQPLLQDPSLDSKLPLSENHTAPLAYADNPFATPTSSSGQFENEGGNLHGGMAPVFILAGPHLQGSSGYHLLTDGQQMYWYGNTSTNESSDQPLLTTSLPPNTGSPSQGSPVLFVRSLGGIQSPVLPRTKRSSSQPASNLQHFRSMMHQQDAVGGTAKHGHHVDLRRYSTPNGSFLPSTKNESNLVPNLEKVQEEGIDGGPNQNYGGYDLIFMSPENETDSLTCPICQLVYRNPYLTDCCGACFCYTCIQRHLSTGGHCPLCNKSEFKVFVNRVAERSVNCLVVKCTQSECGCTWCGPLNALTEHSLNNCQFSLVHCDYCNAKVILNRVQVHLKDECAKRPYSCKFCSFKGIYEDMPLHWPVCEGYPIPCPNECGQLDMPRKSLEEHLLVCPRRRGECQYKFAGCNASFPISESEKHEAEGIYNHLALVSDLVKQLLLRQKQEKSSQNEATAREVERRLTNREKEIASLKNELRLRNEEIAKLQTTVSSLTEDLQDLQTDVSKIKSSVFIPPFYFTVSDFNELQSSSKQWFSQPFYTHFQGYKMCISVDCNGSDEGTGTHVSVYANLMMGEYDDDLTWPFCGVIVIRLINQYSDKNHIDHEVPFSRDVSREIAGRVVENDLAGSGLGVPQFVSRARLGYDRHSNVGYLKSNSLRFCIINVKIIG